MKPLRLALLLFLFGLTTGCATILQGSHQDVRVETDPSGATVSGAGQTITTPGALNFRRNAENLEVLVEKEGYAPCRAVLARKENGTKWANLALVPVGVGIGVGFGSLGSSEEDPLLIQVSDAVFGSEATWGFILGVLVPATGFLVDHVTGAAYRLDPPRLVLRLEPVNATGGAGDPRAPDQILNADIPCTSALRPPEAAKSAEKTERNLFRDGPDLRNAYPAPPAAMNVPQQMK